LHETDSTPLADEMEAVASMDPTSRVTIEPDSQGASDLVVATT